MYRRSEPLRPSTCLLIIAVLLLTGCSALEVNVDVYKGPLANEREIQVKQYAAMAISAKPLLLELYCHRIVDAGKENNKNYENTIENCPAEVKTPGGKSDVDEKPNQAQALAPNSGQVGQTRSGVKTSTKFDCKIGTFHTRFLCEVLALYDNQEVAKDGDETLLAQETKKLALERPYSRDPRYGLDHLTQTLTMAVAKNSGSKEDVKAVREASEALNEALIFFAQRVLYVSNSELTTHGDDKKFMKKAKPMFAVLQSLGNTILVHANDLRRQDKRDTAHDTQLDNENDAVQRAFQPEPSATLAAIIARLKRYTIKASTQATDEPTSTATPEQNAELLQLRKDANDYLSSIAGLIAAHRSVSAKLPSNLQETPPADADRMSIEEDSKAIAALYPDQAITKENKDAGTLKPLQDWLALEMADGYKTAPNRKMRLEGLKSYLETEDARLTAAGITSKDNASKTLLVLTTYLSAQINKAAAYRTEQLNRIETLKAAIKIQDKKTIEELERLARKARAIETETLRKKTVAIVESVRNDVLLAAEQINTRDPKVIHQLLLRQLQQIPAGDKKDKSSPEDINLTLAVLNTFQYPTTPCAAMSKASGCKAVNTIEVVDNLIASLRAQRVQAIAAGEAPLAENLLKAINVAYEQRTAMIYLRPASDYLRSVYTSSQVQDGTGSQYPYMLNDWLTRYSHLYGDKKNGSRNEQEKIHWQNVNKVTLTGGGKTNYVLAKDDVGNWYVKAYSADPESIIKSATSLALFSAGKGINLNLLRRLEVQRQLDEDKSLGSERRAELQKELLESNKQGGQSLLKVRDRYASRYLRETNTHASNLLVVVNELDAKVKAEMAQIEKWPEEDCPIETVKKLLDPLDSKFLASSRDKLTKAVADQTAASKLRAAESSIQATLTGMHLYSSDAQRVLSQTKETKCEAAQRDAGKRVRDYVRAQIASTASERKTSIERYEDALSNILEIADEK